MPELLVQGVVEPQLRSKASQGLSIRSLPDHRLHRVTRCDVEEEEGDD
jgi:hypothetical protein